MTVKSKLPSLITVNELATRLRISPRTAYRLCREAGFPAYRVGVQIRIPTTELERWLQDQLASSGRGQQ